MPYRAPIEIITETFASAILPREPVSLCEWAEAHFRLSPEASSEPGRFRPFAFQREVLDALSPASEYSTVVLCWASQMSKSTMLLSALAHLIAEDPGPVLVVEPNLSMAEAFSKDRLSPMFRDCEALRGLVADPKARDAGSTIFHRRFLGGHVSIVGANSPAGLASRPIRYLFLDEVDRYEESAGAEGDPVALAVARTRSFFNRKIVLTSSPTIKGSRICQAFAESDQRYFEVPCPHCGHYQRLIWERIEYPEGEPEKTAYRCAGCEQMIAHHHKHAMLQAGRWQATNPASRIAGFALSELYSPWRSRGAMAVEYEAAKGNPERLRAFLNTSLAEPWDDAEQSGTTEDSLLARREHYGPRLPQESAILTAGADIQGDRIEVSVFCWTSGEESWLVEHVKLMGDPSRPEVWRMLDEFLLRTWHHPVLGPVPVHAVCVDCGYFTREALAFCEERRGRRIFGVKGRNGPHPVWPKKPSRGRSGRGPMFYHIGVDSAKSTIVNRLKIESGPGQIHFPVTVDRTYFEQLLSEFLKTTYKHGRPHRVWTRRGDRRQAEALDTCVYAYAALAALQSLGILVDHETARIEALQVPQQTPVQVERYEQTRSRWARM
jgi:phage terminase large subunit GpA-like protein